MGSEKTKKVQSGETPAVERPPQETSADEKTPSDFPSEKSPASDENHVAEKKSRDSIDRDSALAGVEIEKRLALIKAWEESEKTKAENKAYKKVSAIGAWENSRRANIEAELKQIEEQFEKKKAESAETMNNKKADIHKAAEEKKAVIEAKRGEEFLKVEETAAKFRSTGTIPKRFFGCFSW